jgi:hypothetical protein
VFNEVVEAIKESERTVVITVNGLEYTTRPVYDARVKDPEIKPLAINTLKGLADYINKNVDILDLKECQIHVASHDKVYLVGRTYGHFKQRDVFVVVSCESLFGGGFNFGQFIDNERFIIALQSLFVQTDEVAAILKVVGNIKEEKVGAFSDDGVSQTVVSKAGIVRVENVVVPNPVKLRPYRTFRDVEAQPESLFVLRMREGNGDLPTCALFEADGGNWKITAITSIKNYLEFETENKVSVIG